MKLSVVVPTRNRARSIGVVLDALLADPGASEIVVIDDGSTDDTPSFLAAAARREHRLRTVRADGVGAAAARQLGVEHCHGDVVLLLDDDVVPGPGLASGHLARHEAARDAGEPLGLVVVGYMPTAVAPTRVRGTFATTLYALEYEQHIGRWVRGELDVLTSLWAGNVSLPRSLCLDVGVVSPGFPPTNHQDRDFGIRLAKHGAHAVFDPELRAAHAHNRPLDAFLRDSYRQGVGRYHLHHLHADVIGAGSLDDSTSGLPPTLRWLVRATDRPAARRTVTAALRILIRLSGSAGRFGVEEQAAKLARRIALRNGYRAAASADLEASIQGHAGDI